MRDIVSGELQVLTTWGIDHLFCTLHSVFICAGCQNSAQATSLIALKHDHKVAYEGLDHIRTCRKSLESAKTRIGWLNTKFVIEASGAVDLWGCAIWRTARQQCPRSERGGFSQFARWQRYSWQLMTRGRTFCSYFLRIRWCLEFFGAYFRMQLVFFPVDVLFSTHKIYVSEQCKATQVHPDLLRMSCLDRNN